MEIVIALMVGVIIGLILSAVLGRRRCVGALRIDTSDPDDGPYMFLELSTGVDVVYRQTYVTLRVDTKNISSHD